MMFLRLLCLMLVAVFIYACGDADKNKKEEKPLESLAKDQSEKNVKEDSLEKKYADKSKSSYKNRNIDLEKNITLAEFENSSIIFFDFDRSNLKPAEFAKLDNQIIYLLKNKNVKAVIEGHTDDVGTREYNLALGERRANTIYRYYIDKGIEKERIRVVSFGKENPIDVGDSDVSKSKNRRTKTSLENK